MKTLFKKEDHSGLWIVAAITGALASGFGIWLYLRWKQMAEQKPYRSKQPQEYLKDRQPKKKQHRSNITDLAEIAEHGHA